MRYLRPNSRSLTLSPAFAQPPPSIPRSSRQEQESRNMYAASVVHRHTMPSSLRLPSTFHGSLLVCHSTHDMQQSPESYATPTNQCPQSFCGAPHPPRRCFRSLFRRHVRWPNFPRDDASTRCQASLWVPWWTDSSCNRCNP